MGYFSYRVHVGAALLVALGLLVAAALNPSDGFAASKLSDWSSPVNLGPPVNSSVVDFAPQISKNELSLYFTSNRTGSVGGEDVWVSQRDTADDPWGPPANLGAVINSAANDRSPALSRDGHYLFFATDRLGGFGGFDIWVSWRAQTHDDFGWGPPINLGAGMNTP